LFRQEGAHVVADASDLQPEGACERAVENAGDVDVLIVNLSHVPRSAPVSQITDDDISSLLSTLVTPLVRLCRAVALPMIARRSGKVVVMSSAAPLRGMPNNAAYCAARGAQNAFVRAAGLEFAPHNVQVNAIAQNYVNNPTYFPPDLIQTERFLKHVQRNIPAQRIGESWESAELALFLASDKSNFIVGQVVPLAGGWATTTG